MLFNYVNDPRVYNAESVMPPWVPTAFSTKRDRPYRRLPQDAEGAGEIKNRVG